MGFWDKVKSFFGGGGGDGDGEPPKPAHDPALVTRVQRTTRKRLNARGVFEAVDIAADLGARDVATVQAACAVVDHLFKTKWFEELGYSRTWRVDNWVYHPVDAPLADPSKPSAAKPGAAKPGSPVTKAAPAVAAPRVDAYAPPSGVLGLTTAELRARAMNVVPWRTAWIGRTDVIPPASDERTALVDRGLVLRGLLTQPEIEEIHRVGDLWLEHKDTAGAARLVGLKTADEAIAELKRQRAALKEKKKREAAEKKQKRAEEIAARRRDDVMFLGRGVSSRLHDRRPHVEKLEALGLPVLATPADVAAALGLTVRELRWLAFHADAADKPHYVYFEVPKRSGGKRMLASPHEKLAAAQRWVLDHVLEKLPLEDAAHGFVRARSTVSNALPHVGRDVVVNLDLSDFFPTITFARVRGLFQRMGYSPAAATVLALLVTECERREVTYAGQRYWVAVRERALPQGACTSPAISNLVARKLDRRLRGVAAKMGWNYTRYADDLTFSAPDGHRGEIGLLMARVRHVVTEEGFALNPKKGRVQRKGRRQTVTGIVVNTQPGVPREEVRRLRAILHAAKTTGLEAQNREGLPNFEAHVRGKLAYLHMVDPAKAAPLLFDLQAIEGRG
jgi:retron-type reverse transcriptase